MIEYENANIKTTHYLVHLINLRDPNDQRQEWFLERKEIVSNPTLEIVMGFYNTYDQIWAMIEKGIILIHCRKATFIYHSELSKYMKVEGPTSTDVFDCLVDIGAEKFLLEKGKRYCMIYLKKGSRAL